MTVIILAGNEHKRAHLLPSFNSIYVFKKVLCAFRILIQIYIKTTWNPYRRCSLYQQRRRRKKWMATETDGGGAETKIDGG